MRKSILTATIALAGAMALGGCASSLYSGIPEDARLAAPQGYEDRSYVGGESTGRQPAQSSAQDDSGQRYEYRGGRDPVTGRAATQL